LGGNYSFTHCTIVTYSSNYINHKNPVLFATNALKQNNQVFTDNLTASFTNCIFWGDGGTAEDEVVIDKQGANTFIVKFDNVLYKVKTDPANTVFTSSIKNQAPVFDSVDVGRRFYDFRLRAESPAVNKGKATSLTIDLDGNPRANGLPDIGCYEKQ
jgi:hypothetical protein